MRADLALRQDLIKQITRIRNSTGLKKDKALFQFKEKVKTATRDFIPLDGVVDLVDEVTTIETEIRIDNE